VQEGAIPDNRIDFGKLRRLDRDLLRDALRVVREFQEVLGSRYRHGL
jgi:signal-transduction protein with cAMP-binding, CBS, and nucleotidyltransferase domain